MNPGIRNTFVMPGFMFLSCVALLVSAVRSQ